MHALTLHRNPCIIFFVIRSLISAMMKWNNKEKSNFVYWFSNLVYCRELDHVFCFVHAMPYTRVQSVLWVDYCLTWFVILLYLSHVRYITIVSVAVHITHYYRLSYCGSFALFVFPVNLWCCHILWVFWIYVNFNMKLYCVCSFVKVLFVYLSWVYLFVHLSPVTLTLYHKTNCSLTIGYFGDATITNCL